MSATNEDINFGAELADDDTLLEGDGGEGITDDEGGDPDGEGQGNDTEGGSSEGDDSEGGDPEGDSGEGGERSEAEDDEGQGVGFDSDLVELHEKMLDPSGRIGAEVEIEEYEALDAELDYASRKLNILSAWDNGQLSPQECAQYRLPLRDKVGSIQLDTLKETARDLRGDVKALTAKHSAFSKERIEALTTVRGVIQFNKTVDEIAEKAGVPVKDLSRAQAYVFSRAAARDGSAWLANRAQAARDLRAYFAKNPGGKASSAKAAGAKAGAAAAAKATPNGAAANGSPKQSATNTPKKRVVPVSSGKSSGLRPEAKTGARVQSPIEKELDAWLVSRGRNPKDYTGEQRTRLLAQMNGIKKNQAAPTPKRKA